MPVVAGRPLFTGGRRKILLRNAFEQDLIPRDVLNDVEKRIHFMLH
jgi:hypothetical protein